MIFSIFDINENYNIYTSESSHEYNNKILCVNKCRKSLCELKDDDEEEKNDLCQLIDACSHVLVGVVSGGS